MEIFKEIFANFKELLYDVFGFILPGYLVLAILCLPFVINKCSSPMYSLLEILFKNNNFRLTFLFQNLSFLTVLIVSFIAYLLGHLPIYLSCPLGRFLDFLLKENRTTKSKDYNKTEIIFTKVFEILETKSGFPKDLFYFTNNENNLKPNKDIVKTFSSTYSRFTSHNNLIQKYTYKVNFYNSLSCIFFIIFIDSIISSFVWGIANSSILTFSILAGMLVLSSFLLLCFLTFLSQYDRHSNLRNKECYLFLLNVFDLAK